MDQQRFIIESLVYSHIVIIVPDIYKSHTVEVSMVLKKFTAASVNIQII
jgi:hypothetical protein